MPYRRTENVARRLAARHEAIIAAATALAAEGGIAAVQIAPVAERAGIAAGTVYRYFPAKSALVAALTAAVSAREIERLQRAAKAAPGPVSALCAAIATLATRLRKHRRLAWALLGEPAEPEIDAARAELRQALASELAVRLAAAAAAGQLPQHDTSLTAAALLGSLVEALVGPLAAPEADPGREQARVQDLTLLALRGVGLVDARARGLIVQATAAAGRAGPVNATSAPEPSSN